MVKSHIWKDGAHFADQDLSDGVSGNGSPVVTDGTNITDTFGSGSGDFSYAFTTVITSGPMINSDTPDPSTETFQQTTAANSGPYVDDYLWSNSANWNTGIVPADGDSVITNVEGFNVDDIAGLTLDSLTQNDDADTYVVAASLNVGTVAGDGDLLADAFLAGAPVTVTVGTITGTESVYQAVGTGAVLVDNSATDPGDNLYVANSGGLVELATAPASTSTLKYVGPPGTMALENPGTTIAAALENLGAGDVLELPGSLVSNVTFGTTSLDVTTNAGTYDFTNVTYASGSTINSFTAAPDTSTGLEAITFAICFCKGSLIRTPSGDVPVEMLGIGDIVATWCGSAAPIRWIGRQTVSTRFGDPTRILPIRIKAGALGDHVPSRDLLVSPDHAILVEEILIQAGALVNGGSIVRETNVPQTFTYYHVELDDHSLILVENTPAETFIDNVDRLAFDNWQEHDELYPGGKPIVEMPYPRAKAHRQVPRAIREKLAERAAMPIGKTQQVAA